MSKPLFFVPFSMRPKNYEGELSDRDYELPRIWLPEPKRFKIISGARSSVG
jgi:hypothetical protein